MPTSSGTSSTVTPASPVASLRASKIAAPAMTGVAIRNENRAAGSRARPANQTGRDGDARAADARDERERLCHADAESERRT